MYFFLFLIFLTTVSLAVFLYLVFYQTKDQILDRLEEQENRTIQVTYEEAQDVDHLLKNRLFDYFTTTNYYKKQTKLLSRAYIRIKPEELIIISSLIGFVFFIILFIYQNNLFLAILFFLVGLFIPRSVIKVLATIRAKQLNAQLPQALSLISNGLRAGFSFNQALGIVRNEMDAPISEEFGQILNENQLGKPMDEVLTEFRERTNDEDLSIFLTTVLTQLQVGGNLAEILDIIANTIRERAELKGEIDTLTSQSKFSAIVIGFLPVGLATVIYLLNPEYMSLLFTDPLGLLMVISAGIMLTLGIFVLFQIVNIKI